MSDFATLSLTALCVCVCVCVWGGDMFRKFGFLGAPHP